MLRRTESTYICQLEATKPAIEAGKNIWNTIGTENALMLSGVGLLIIVMAITGGGGSNKNKIARGVLAGDREKKQALKRAIAQMAERKHNSVGLYAGSPPRNKEGKVKGGGKSLWIPDGQRGVITFGGPGSGKSYSMVNPAIRSSLDQGFPTIVYDFKYPDQSEVVVGYAAKRGYDIRVFAPGYPESEVCNPLDFLDSETDALMARQIATVMCRNFANSSSAADDKFFTAAAEQLTLALFLLTKALPIPDLMTAAAILSLPDLPKRIENAKRLADLGKLPNGWEFSEWIYIAFNQLIQLGDSGKTVAGVIGTAIQTFNRFMAPELIATFCGKTTLPIDMEGKQLLILGLDRNRRDAIAPLVATILHLVVTRNVTRKRKDPLVVFIDELPTLILPYLVQWLNENRSDGFCGFLALQNITQLEKAYGREVSRSILGGCASKAFFNPQDPDSAQLFSQYLGEEQFDIKQKSISRGKGGTTKNVSFQSPKRAIFEPAQFNKLPTGKCIFINPGYKNKTEGSIPLIKEIKIPKRDQVAETESKKLWPKIRNKLIKRSSQIVLSNDQSKTEIARRLELATSFLPPVKKDTPTGGSSKNTVSANSRITDPVLLAKLKAVF